MTWSSRLLVLVALVGVISAPIATLHPVTVHLFDAGERGIPTELQHAAILSLFILVGASLVPLTSLVAIGWRWSRRLQDLDMLARVSQGAVTEDGLTYWLAPVPGVRFFTTGLTHPRIYASVEARQQLSLEAFRAALLHEREHQRRHDVAWRWALAALEAAFRPFPAIRRAVSDLALDCEFAADRAALLAGARREHLFEAMAAAASVPVPTASMGLSSAGTVERMTALIEPSFQPPVANSLPIVWLVAGLALLPLAAHMLFWVGAVCL